MEVDYIISGQGVAGTVLAHVLTTAGKLVMVVDDGHLSSASKVAVGTFNPVVFRKLNLSWKIVTLLKDVHKVYGELEELLGKSLIVPRSIFKTLNSEEEVQFWQEKSRDPDLMDFLDEKLLPSDAVGGVIPSRAYGRVMQAGNIRLRLLLSEFRSRLKQHGKLIEGRLDPMTIKADQGGAIWNDIRCRKVIFCDGFRLQDHPEFNWLKLRPVKGEVLIIRPEGYHSNDILHRGINLVPMDEGLYWAGGTYEWKDLSLYPTEAKRELLEDKLNALLDVPYEVTDQWVGIRPTVADRRPLIGVHPRLSHLAVFNGMGTKGVMLAPYFAKQLSAHLEDGSPLHPEVDIQRYAR